MLINKKSHKSTGDHHENAKSHLVFYIRASDIFCNVYKLLVPKKKIERSFFAIDQLFNCTELFVEQTVPTAYLSVIGKNSKTVIDFFKLCNFLLHTNLHLNSDL